MGVVVRLLLVIALAAITGLAPIATGAACDVACLAACSDSDACEDGGDEGTTDLAAPAPVHDAGGDGSDDCPYGCTACACSGARIAAIVPVSVSLAATTGSIDSCDAPDRVWPSRPGPRIFHPPRHLAA